MQQGGNPIEAKDEPPSFEQRFHEAMYNACVHEAPKLKEKIDMALSLCNSYK